MPNSTSTSSPTNLDELLPLVRDARFSRGLRCPRCGHHEIQRWGSFSGRQRYRCKGCLRTFSDLTGTPAAYLKKVHLLPGYNRCLAASFSIRRAAAEVGVHPCTAFRWRHRLLDWLRTHDQTTVSGWVELDAFSLAESRKGARDLERPARRRGVVHAWDQGPRIQVVVACDRLGHVVSVKNRSPAPWVTAEGIEEALLDRLEGWTNLTARHSALRACRKFARWTGARLHDPPLWHPGDPDPRGRARSLVHVRTVHQYVLDLRRWLWWFRGVATRYLANYLAWHRLLDGAVRNGVLAVLMRWPACEVG